MKTVLWIEEYSCGCSTEAPLKKELLGYCAQHGSSRRSTYQIINGKRSVDGKLVIWTRQGAARERREDACKDQGNKGQG